MSRSRQMAKKKKLSEGQLSALRRKGGKASTKKTGGYKGTVPVSKLRHLKYS